MRIRYERGAEEGLHDAVRRPERCPTLKNLWSDRDARAMVRKFAKRGVGRDLALRIYTTRLLGGDPALALHGGGNTSVKTVLPDLLGEPVEVLCVKGSGWDMAAIEPAGLPAVRLAPLRRLAGLDALGDEEMVGVLRGNLLDAGAPNPSIETLLHAFLPQKFVDHTHAQRRPRAHRPARRRRDLRHRLRRPRRRGALRHVGIRAGQADPRGAGGRPGRRGSDPDQARRLHGRRNGQGLLRSHDRGGFGGRGPHRQGPGARYSLPRCPGRSPRPGTWRRSCAALPQSPWTPASAGSPVSSSTFASVRGSWNTSAERTCADTASRGRRRPRPRRPHQAQAPRRAGARSGQAG